MKQLMVTYGAANGDTHVTPYRKYRIQRAFEAVASLPLSLAQKTTPAAARPPPTRKNVTKKNFHHSKK